MSYDVIPAYVKLMILAAILAATAGFTYHKTSTTYIAKVTAAEAALGEANTKLENAGKAIDVMNDGQVKLREAIAKQNAATQAAKVDADRRAAVLAAELAAARTTAAKDRSRLLALQKITAPIVELTGMTPVQIKTEISICRRAVDISNTFQDQESNQ